ncbi:cupin [Pacificimonas flava]|uniref:Cupin n=2 Tax=Pacificimonas TaxID=1960290 RepID=A0A219B0G0_9SPHN|nr:MULTISPECIES: cupin domain-containing protein [Pacificimonas]MBZ6379745.1 cupin domain-containing protein [Pacificimonas aurantium]OWV31800.1 cupin [Pacificimonas flava]
MTDARTIIETLGLERHPEGGWYRETWRRESDEGGRGTATGIYYLLPGDERSHWHRVDADEMWLWHAGAPLVLSLAETDEGPARDHVLGADLTAGQRPQVLVPAQSWEAARPDGGWSLVSCIVSPAFDFEGFILAPAAWRPGA